MKKTLFLILSAVALALSLCACGTAQDGGTSGFSYRFAAASEAEALMRDNQAYYDGFSQNDLDYRMQKKDASMAEYLALAREQFLDFTEEEKALLDASFSRMEDTLREKGYTLPPLDEILLVKTSMLDESGAGAYTHGTRIYLGEDLLRIGLSGGEDEDARLLFEHVLWHELFHCLTRCSPDFRADMYRLIHFTVREEDYPIPPSVFAYHISNPDVEHHNASATFRIDGRDIECFTDFITTKHFEKEGDTFVDYATAALIPIDGTDTYYTPEQAENFDAVFGTNTDYVVDPEECLADNFSFAIRFGMDGPSGHGYPNPEIIEGILAYLGQG